MTRTGIIERRQGPSDWTGGKPYEGDGASSLMCCCQPTRNPLSSYRTPAVLLAATTEGGSVRFNPNLYLLGTWEVRLNVGYPDFDTTASADLYPGSDTVMHWCVPNPPLSAAAPRSAT